MLRPAWHTCCCIPPWHADLIAWATQQLAAITSLLAKVRASPLSLQACTAGCCQLLQLAACVAPAGGVLGAADVAAQVLQALPAPDVAAGGRFHAALRQWLLPRPASSSEAGSGAAQEWLATGAEQAFDGCMRSSAAASSAAAAAGSSSSSSSPNASRSRVSGSGMQAVATAEDYQRWQQQAGAWFMLQLIAPEALQHQLQVAGDALTGQLQALYSRPYLQPLAAERVLVTLCTALDAVEACQVSSSGGSGSRSGSGSSSGSGVQQLEEMLGQALSLAAEPLASYAALSAGSFSFSGTSGELAGGSGGSGAGSGAGSSQAWADAARGLHALRAAGRAAVLLMRLHRSSAAGGGSSLPAGIQKLVGCLTGFASMAGGGRMQAPQAAGAPTATEVGLPGCGVVAG
jgi:hypothetical protein